MGGFVWVFPDFGKSAGTPLGGGGSAFWGGWVAELLFYWNSSVHLSACGRLSLCMRKQFFHHVDHSKAGDNNVHSGN